MNWLRRITTLALALGLLWINAGIQPTISRLREPWSLGGERYGPSFVWLKNFASMESKIRGDKDLSLESVSMVVVLGIAGGFRSVAADVLWLKSDEWWHKGQADRMIPLLRLVTWLDPNFIDGWRIAGWHWAYNLRVQAPTPEGRERCMQQGLDYLREGVAWNPERQELYFELGWTNSDKVGDMQEAAEWYERALALSLLQGLSFGLKQSREDMLKTEWKEIVQAADLAQRSAVDRNALAELYELDKRPYSRAFRFLIPNDQKLRDKRSKWTRAPSPDVILRMLAHSVERMPDFPHAVKTYEVVLEITPEERQKLREFVRTARRADMDPDEFQQAVEKYTYARPDDPKRAELLSKHPLVAEGTGCFDVFPVLRRRDTVAPGAILTILGRYKEPYDLMARNQFVAARAALFASHERYYRFQAANSRKQPLEQAVHDAFVAAKSGDYEAVNRIVCDGLAKAPKGSSRRDLQPLEDAKRALENKDRKFASDILESATIKDTLYSHLLARIYEREAKFLERSGKQKDAAQQWRRAFQVWFSAMTFNASDNVARNRVEALASTVGARISIPEIRDTYDPRNQSTLKLRR